MSIENNNKLYKFESKQAAHDYLRTLPKERLEIDQTVIIHWQYVEIGREVAIGPYSVIGKAGFGYEQINGKWQRVNHVGKVILQDGVEIGANTCIDRAKLEATIIGEGTKIDNLVHIGHNAIIGKHCLIVAGSVIGGSCILGDNVFVGQNATIKDHVKVGSNVIIGCGANVVKDVPDNVTVAGNPAIILKAHV